MRGPQPPALPPHHPSGCYPLPGPLKDRATGHKVRPSAALGAEPRPHPSPLGRGFSSDSQSRAPPSRVSCQELGRRCLSALATRLGRRAPLKAWAHLSLFPAEAEGCLRGLGRISACQPLTQRPCESLNISEPQLPSAEIKAVSFTSQGC